MALTPAQLALRENKITASFLPALMKGDDAAIYNKWLELIGDPKWVPEDLSENWQVLVGEILEEPAIKWHERKTGQALTRRGEVVVHPRRPYFCCTLDCFREADQSVIDAKACGSFMDVDTIIKYYTPQLVGQKGCTTASRAAILLCHGFADPRELELEITPEYEALVWKRVDAFQQCVEHLTPPVPMPEVVPPEKWRTVNLDSAADFDAHNWSADMLLAFGDWLANKDAAKRFEESKETVKALLPADVGTVLGGGCVVKRDRRNAVTIRHRGRQ